MKHIAVLAGRVDETERHTLEDGFVSALTSYGVQATPSYALFPDGQVPSDPAAIRTTLQKEGYDGSLVATLRGVTEQVTLVPGADWGGAFYGAYWGPGTPAYAETDQYVKFETTLWSPSSGKLVWSANTETENPRSGHDFAHSLTGKVVPSLAKAGLIPPGPPVSFAR